MDYGRCDVYEEFPVEPYTQSYSPRQAREFKKFFDANLADYWHGPMLGFDVVKFDEEIVKTRVQSVRAAVRQSYGVDAVLLIESLVCQGGK